MLSKQEQLKKNKKANPKKMPKALYQNKCDWLFEKYAKCPYCLLRPSNQIHHTEYGYFGAKGSDLSITPICEVCHYDIHHGTKSTEGNREQHIQMGKGMHEEWEATSGQGYSN